MAGSLTIYKASAGSGKTFTLAVRYIALVAGNPELYKHILAVTFTNKATAEMKDRIVQHLYGISHSLPESNAYLEKIKQLLPQKSTDEIRQNTGSALDRILHDYSNFHIETIDSFFQRILRGMAKELQIGHGMQLELDTDSAIQDAVDRFIENIEPGSPELEWIIDFINNTLDDGKNLRLDESLSAFSKKLFQEEFQEKGQELRDYLQEKGKLKSFAGKMSDIIRTAKANVTDAANRVFLSLSALGLDTDDMTRGLGTFVKDSLSADLDKINTDKKSIANAYSDKWKLLPAKFKNSIADNSLDEIHSHFCSLVDTISTSRIGYNTAVLSRQYLYELNLLASIRKQIDKDNSRLNRFVIADTCALLSRMHQGDTSFIFEKTGSAISHIMIDESQDTSTLQWRNLNIILLETLSQNNQSLVVGDVKQAIYRWRNGNWQYLNSKLKDQVFARFSPKEESLSENFRSLENIVRFNNRIFEGIIQYVQDYHNEAIGCEYKDLKTAYSDVHQTPHDNSGKGYVHVQLFESDSDNKDTIRDLHNAAIADAIYEYISQGVNINDIAILLRFKKEIIEISQILENDGRFKGIPIISDEAYELGASTAINILITALRYLYDTTDRIAEEALKLYTDNSNAFDNFVGQISTLAEMSIYQAAQAVCNIFELDRAEGQTSYLNTFFDNLSEYLQGGCTTIKDFLDFWDKHMHTVTVPAEAKNGITLMTVHKSKGLEFHTVIIPYADWDLTRHSGPDRPVHIWSRTDKEPYSEIPLIPIEFSAKMKDSHFKESYKSEFGMQLVDNLNLLYVALTRARCNLTIFGENDKKTIASSIVSSLVGKYQVDLQDNCYSFSTGVIEPSHETRRKESENPFNYTTSPLYIQSQYFSELPDFKESVAASRFIGTIGSENSDTQEKQDRYIQTGQLLHRIFSEINTKEQVGDAIANMVRQGLVGPGKEQEYIQKFVTKALEKKEVAEWFSGNYRLINEGTILFKQDNKAYNKRPDRIMLYQDRTVVVDFKFGKERPEYVSQVKEYISLLRAMGMPNVEGYIWYVYSGSIDAVV